MPRPQRCRRICQTPQFAYFSPDGAPQGEAINLSLDEFEAIRLVDLEKQTHEQCASQMDISRTTVTEIYERARSKIADFIVNGKALVISGGNCRICNGEAERCCGKRCDRASKKITEEILQNGKLEGENIMKIAVTYDDGKIFQHFGHTECFGIYDVENGEVIDKKLVNTNGSGHSALAGFLKGLGVDALICGGIGGGARRALDEAGIKLYGGAVGDADEAAAALASGKLEYNPDAKCDEHHERHEHHGRHACGEHGCGRNHHSH